MQSKISHQPSFYTNANKGKVQSLLRTSRAELNILKEPGQCLKRTGKKWKEHLECKLKSKILHTKSVQRTEPVQCTVQGLEKQEQRLQMRMKEN